ncbi:MAG: undecaprenyl-diphosphate phosphatase [Bacillota bacterium]|nr:undecaprenyl-diphosphate phosphatase [Bacillota bacterium]
MTIFQAIIYGIVQGIGEFLPISSTAHLIFLSKLFGTDPGTVFDVALHLGTAVAVLLFFIKDWIRLIRAGFTKPKSNDGKLFWLLVLATIPGGIAGVALDKYMGGFNNTALIGLMLIIMGIVLYAADKLGRNEIDLHRIGVSRSLLVGISQVLAVVPGVSRSGATMSAGRALGITRESIARFTFLMSAPLILGDALFHAKDLGSAKIPVAPFIVAVLTAAVVGILSIRFLLNYLKRNSFGVFAVYRFIVGTLAIILFFLKVIK